MASVAEERTKDDEVEMQVGLAQDFSGLFSDADIDAQYNNLVSDLQHAEDSNPDMENAEKELDEEEARRRKQIEEEAAAKAKVGETFCLKFAYTVFLGIMIWFASFYPTAKKSRRENFKSEGKPGIRVA